jgi:hypothetical protein
MLAQSMLHIEELIKEASKEGNWAHGKLTGSVEAIGAPDGQICRSLLLGSCATLSTKEKISAQEASVALDYIDHVKELRDEAADLEKECEENRQACNSAKV